MIKMKQAISEFETYLSIQKGYSPLTVAAYKHDLLRFHGFMQSKQLGDVVDSVTPQHIYDYLSYLAHPSDNKRPNSAVTRARKLASVRSFFNFLHRYQKIDTNPSSMIEVPSVPLKEPEYLTQKEYLQFLNTIKEKATPFYRERDIAIALLFLGTGIRVSELVGLELKNVDLDSATIKVKRKGNKEQTIPLSSSVLSSLAEYIRVRPACNYNQVFISRKLSPLRTNSVYYLVKKYLNLAGIKKNKQGPHVLRHTCFTSLLSKNVNPVIIQQLAGHNSFDTTRRYLHLNNKQVREAVNQICLEKGTE